MTPDNRRDEVLKKPANKTKALETLRKYANKNAKWPRISELKKEFENHKGKMQRVKHNPFTSDRGKIMHAYQKLLNGVASEASLDIIKQEKARKLLLKKRLAVQITLKDNNGTLAVINAYGVLVEQSKHMAEYWVGKVIESSGIEKEVAAFRQEIGAQSTNYSISGKRGMVSTIETEWSFA